MPSLRYAMLRGQYTRGRQPLAADGRRWAVAHCRCPRRGDPRPRPRLPPGTRGLHPLCLRAGTYCGRYRSVLLSEQPYRVPFLWGTRPASASAQRPPLPCGACAAAIPRPCSSPAQGGSFLLVRVRVMLFFFSTRMSTSSIVFFPYEYPSPAARRGAAGLGTRTWYEYVYRYGCTGPTTPGLRPSTSLLVLGFPLSGILLNDKRCPESSGNARGS